MSRSEDAVDVFARGFNCAQAVFSAFAPDLGMDREKAMKVAMAFGGGMARSGLTCGAVTGALMVIGMRHGMSLEKDKGSKEETYSRTLRFMDAFRERHGAVSCRELLGCDISTPDGMREASEKGSFTTLCPRFVREAVRILEGME
jgi:C_GCAxxG_C_C family probable redox protein